MAVSTVLGQDGTHLEDGPVEHVVIEGDSASHSPPIRGASGPVLLTYTLASSFHRCATEVAVHKNHYLAVRKMHPSAGSLQYDVDLRFADPTPIRCRTTSWRWLTVTGLALTAALAASVGTVVDERFLGMYWVMAVLACAAGIAALVATCRRTTESLELRSVHGRVALVRFVAGIGSTKGAERFVSQLADHIELARVARPRETRQYLCDEMREHHRLYELGALTDEQYAAGKARILAAH